MTLTAVVVEDQPEARRYLRGLLDRMPDVSCVAEAADGERALEVIARHRPDVAFLDIELPGLSGLEVLRRSDPRPVAIFTTAFDDFAVTAFELHALDYLLKPFGEERLRQAVDRAVEFAERVPTARVDEMEAALESGARLSRVYVRSRGGIVPVLLRDVEHLEARGDYVALWTDRRSHLLRIPLSHLMRRMDPGHFLRVHRSHAINLERVTKFTTLSSGRLEVHLQSGKTVRSSRSRVPEIRKRIATG